MRTWLARARPLLALAGAAAIGGVLLPPAGGYARHYQFVAALQFVIFACAAPALLVLGAPWRWPGLCRAAGRLGRWRARHPGALRAACALAAFIAAAVIWRLPGMIGAVASTPGLAVAEMVTLVGTGSAVWLELVESPPLLPGLPRQQRAAMAAVSMWTIWILGYLLGLSHAAWSTAFDHLPGQVVSAAADQQIATAVLWAGPAICFLPVIFVSLMTWLRDSEDPDQELRRVSARGPGRGGLPGAPRPPRGWRTPSA
jgi:cytochrome c oxidase assembly factor CtaG